MKKMLFASILVPSLVSAYPYVPKTDVKLSDKSAISGMQVVVYSDNSIEVQNHSDKDIDIWAQYNICVDGCGCDPHHWKVTVAATGTWHDSWRPMKFCIFNSPGNYQIRSESIVDGLDVDFHNEKIGYATVLVR